MTTTITIVHREREARTGLCGDVMVPTTQRDEDVTCRRCLHRMELAVRPADAPFVPTGPEVRERGTWKLDEAGVGRDAIIRDRAGEDPQDGPRWSSLDKATAQCLRIIDDGTPIRSSYRDEAPVQNSGSAAGAFGGREDVLAWRRALERAFTGPRVFGDVVIVEERCRAILEARLCGVRRVEAIQSGRKGTIARRYPVTAAELAEALSAELGHVVTDHQVGLIYREGRHAMRMSLERAGMLRPGKRREQPRNHETTEAEAMAIGQWDTEGWAEIAAEVGRGIRSCQEYAARDDDPMPVKILLGRAVAKKAELHAWLERQARAVGAA